MNALALPAALRFNAEAAPGAVARFGDALGTDDPAARVEQLARLGGFERLRDFGVPESDLGEVPGDRRACWGEGEPAQGDRRGRRVPPALDLLR